MFIPNIAVIVFCKDWFKKMVYKLLPLKKKMQTRIAPSKMCLGDINMVN